MKLERLHFPTLSGPAIFDSAARLSTAAFALVAVLLAGSWLSELTAPRPVAELPSTAMVQSESATGSISRLFATADVKSADVEGLQLTGVYAGTRGGGFATIATRTGNVHVFPGDEVVPGIVLKHIERDRVTLLASGVEKELMLPELAVPTAESPPQTVTNPPRQTFQVEQER
ncbi:MAG: hypothetical protein MUE59_04910 [Thiobacillaceae bacterium]|jgi:hypothetical protein|nr:hypothetical protein [Thiobacillaceae bacterium]